MTKKTKIIIVLLLLAAALAVGAVLNSPCTSKVSDWFDQNAPKLNVLDAAPDSEAPFKNFIHPVYRFSFDYPVDWSAGAFLQEDKEILLVQSQNQETGIAVLVYPFDEPGPLTKKRVLRDVPDIKMENEIVLKIGGVDALGFDSQEREFGPTKEVWFAHSGFLYQLAAASGSGETLYLMTETWKFQ